MSDSFKLPVDTEPVSENIDDFLKAYFGEITTYMDKENASLEKFTIERMPDIDYLKLDRFFSAAVDQLRSLDTSVYVRVSTFFLNIKENIRIYRDMVKKSVSSNHIFTTEYIRKYNKYYMHLNDESLIIKNKQGLAKGYVETIDFKMKELAGKGKGIQDKEYKALNKKLVDSLYTVETSSEKLALINKAQKDYIIEVKSEFISTYDVYFLQLRNDLASMIDTKLYLFNKILWGLARKSKHVVRFFETIIEDRISLSTYIKYYLDTQCKVSDDLRPYLEQCMKTLNEFDKE